MEQHPEDQILINDILRGGSQAETAFTSLTVKYGRSLYVQIFRILGNEEQTKDVLQNVFVKIWTQISKFKGDAALYSWMYRIARNETLSFIQKEKLRTHLPLDAITVGFVAESNLSEHYTESDISQLLEQAIESLPEKQALVFQLKYFDDLKYSEIAAMIGTSEGALKASYHHATQKIELFLKNKLNHSLS
ncbi:MAG: sigma-70 family RNA polymerase sigma factor [Bacteroidota bacterium]